MSPQRIQLSLQPRSGVEYGMQHTKLISFVFQKTLRRKQLHFSRDFSFVAGLNQPKHYVVPWNSPVNYHASPVLTRNHTKHRQKKDKIIHTIPSCDTTSLLEPMEREWLCIKMKRAKDLLQYKRIHHQSAIYCLRHQIYSTNTRRFVFYFDTWSNG